MKKLTKKYTFTGAGSEIPAFDVTSTYKQYIFVGAVTAVGNYALTWTGTPKEGDTFDFHYLGTVDITTNGTTFSVFGVSLTQTQLNSKLHIYVYYDLTSAGWNVEIIPSFDEAVVGTANLVNDSVTNAKLAEVADLTLKGNISGGTANPSDIPISTINTYLGNWKIIGNAGLVAGTNFLGTTDNVDVVFKRDSVESGRLNSTNTSLGVSSLLNVAAGGLNNTAIGVEALTSLTTGDDNIAIGQTCSNNLTTGIGNVVAGVTSGTVLTTGSYNTLLGNQADVDLAGALGRIALGSNAVATEDYQFIISPAILTVEFNQAYVSTGTTIEKRIGTSANVTTTLTTDQVKFGYITSTSAAPTTLTLPTGALLGVALGATRGTIFKIYFDNSGGASILTIAVSVGGVLSASAVANPATLGLLTIPFGATGVGEFTLMFTSATTFVFSRTA